MCTTIYAQNAKFGFSYLAAWLARSMSCYCIMLVHDKSISAKLMVPKHRKLDGFVLRAKMIEKGNISTLPNRIACQ